MSAPRQLFEQFRKKRFSLIDKAVKDKRQEDLYLEFKTSKTTDGALTTDDRKNYARTASGFANSDGGVIVWGVIARRDRKTGIDAASRLKPIKNVTRFLSDLNTQLVNLVSPGIEGIEQFLIKHRDNKKDGYIVTLVPKGEGPPHMVLAGKDRGRHYHRVSSSFVVMETYLLADRFGRRPQPKLEFAWSLAPDSTDGVALLVGLRNVGRGVALYPALEVQESERVTLISLDGNRNYGLPRRPTHGSRARVPFFAGGVNDAVHPGTVLWVARIRWTTGVIPQPFDDVTIHYSLHCEGFSKEGGEETIPGDEVVRTRREAG